MRQPVINGDLSILFCFGYYLCHSHSRSLNENITKMSSSSEYSIVYQYIKKLGFIDNEILVEKTNELLRRLETKSMGHISKFSDNAKTVICVDLASEMMDLQMDSKLLLRLSGFGKSEYLRNKRTFEKILDVAQNFDIPKICIQLGISHVQKSAQQLYNDYTRYASHLNNAELDLTHPQYFAMAVYMACKKDKVKVLKTNLVKLSHLKSQQWEKLEHSWNSVMDISKTRNVSTKMVLGNSGDDIVPTSKKISDPHYKDHTQNYINNYNSWKSDLLRKSYKNLVDSKSVEFIDIYIIGFVLNLQKEHLEKAKQLLATYFKFIKISDNRLTPKFSAMAIYKTLGTSRDLEKDIKYYLLEYSNLTQLQWNEFEDEWIKTIENVGELDGVTLQMKYVEFDKWIIDFERI